MAGRPREFDRDKALERARDLFWSRGYEGTSIADLVSNLGLAPARIYAAFGSKEDLFREAVAHYRENEGMFPFHGFEEQEPTVYRAIERMLQEAVRLYYLPGRPRGCMMVSAATNCSKGNEAVMTWLAELRRARTAMIATRLRRGVESGELTAEMDAEVLADYFVAILNGMSVQARDGVPKKRLLAFTAVAMQVLDAASA